MSMTADAAGSAGKTGPERFGIVVNPDAGGERTRFVGMVAATLTAQGREVVIEEATARGRIFEFARTAGTDAILVAGGDGSVNEAVRGLLARPAPPSLPRPRLGVIPCGTVNVLAHELGLPRAPEPLAGLFLRGKTRPLHAGLANGKPFVLMASAGLDAAVVKSVDLRLKKRIGRAAYAVAAARALLSGDFPDVEAETDAGVLRAKCIVVAKAKHYGGPFVIDAAADVTQPGLSLVALTEISPRATLALARYFARGETDAAGCIRRLAVKRVRLSGVDIATQIDGDYYTQAPVEITEAEEALAILA